eukprot:4938584-Prymnesium_polylepis.1
MQRAQKLRDEMTTMHEADEVEQMQEQLDLARDLIVTLKDAKDALAEEMEALVEEARAETEELAERLAQSTAGPGKGHFAETHAAENLTNLKTEIGMDPRSVTVPARECET